MGSEIRERCDALIERVTALTPLIVDAREQIERERRVTEPIIDALREADVFRLVVPERWGGLGLDFESYARVVEAVGRVDGSTAWVVMINAGTGLYGGYLPDEGAQAVWGDTADSIVALIVTGLGTATPVEGGYLVTGRWPFASSIHHTDWAGIACQVREGDGFRPGQFGAPEVRMFFVPTPELELLDTWHASGLRGSDSGDIVAHELFVPEARSHPHWQGRADAEHGAFRVPFPTWGQPAIATVALGLARCAIDTVTEQVGGGQPAETKGLPRERVLVQTNIARAEALLGAARSFFFEATGAAWATAMATGALPPALEARKRLSAVHLSDTAVQVIELMYKTGGTRHVYTSSLLGRVLRDALVMEQHRALQPLQYETAGRELLGVPALPPASERRTGAP